MDYPDGPCTKVIAETKGAAIESYVTIHGARIKYRLEGNPAGTTLVLINSILVNWGIWDKFVSLLRGPKFRFSGSRGTTREAGMEKPAKARSRSTRWQTTSSVFWTRCGSPKR